MSKITNIGVIGVLGITVPVVVLTFALSMLWWNAWMYEGWPGPSGRIAASLFTFNEAYDDVMAEIVALSFFVIFAGTAALSLFLRRALNRHGKSVSDSIFPGAE